MRLSSRSMCKNPMDIPTKSAMAQWLVGRWGAINTLVKFAAALLPNGEKTLKRETVDRIGDDIAKKPIVDIRAAIWKVVWMLSGDLEPNEKCKDPWKRRRDRGASSNRLHERDTQGALVGQRGRPVGLCH